MRASVAHIETDVPIYELEDSSWARAQRIAIDKYWSGEIASAGRRSFASLLWSDSFLYARFDAKQTEPLFVNEKPRTSEKTMRLWEHDVCELFVAHDRTEPRQYAEFEISPTGEWLDLMVDWTKEEPRNWDYESGMESYALVQPELVTMVMKIPWVAFATKPSPGDLWLGNLFRQVGSGETRGYLAWAPTMTAEPQFHVPEKFGEFVFVK